MGPIGSSCKGDDALSCIRITVHAGTKQINRHHIEIQYEVKDTGISDMMQTMYQLDFFFYLFFFLRTFIIPRTAGTFILKTFEILGWCPAGSVLPHGEKVPL